MNINDNVILSSKTNSSYLTVPSASSSTNLKPLESNSNHVNEFPTATSKLFSRQVENLEDEKLNNWRPSSSSSALQKAAAGENFSGSESDDSIKELMERVNAGRKKVQFSERSRKLLEDSQELLDSIGSRDSPQHIIGISKSCTSSMGFLPST